MDLLFLVLSIFDGMVVGAIAFLLIKFLLGDKPFARLIKLLLGVASGVAYAALCFNIVFGETDVILGSGLFWLLAPVAVVAILWVISYMYKDKK